MGRWGPVSRNNLSREETASLTAVWLDGPVTEQLDISCVQECHKLGTFGFHLRSGPPVVQVVQARAASWDVPGSIPK
jgi:hypothetical protein